MTLIAERILDEVREQVQQAYPDLTILPALEQVLNDRERFRLAWMSARQRAANHFKALVESDQQRDLLEECLEDEQGSHAMTASSFEVFIDSMKEQAQAATAITDGLRQQLATTQQSAIEHAERHRQIFEAHLRQVAELTDERDEARAEVVRLGKQVEAARKAHDELLRREVDHSGSGREGHLSADDLRPLFDALFPKWSDPS